MRKARSKRSRKWPWIIAFFLASAVGLYLWQETRPERNLEPEPAIPDVLPPNALSPQEESRIRFPIEESAVGAAPSSTLPELDESDAFARRAMSSLLDNRVMQGILRNENVIRHIVVTVDNLPRSKIASRLLPVQPPQGRLRTQQAAEEMTIAKENYRRYEPYVAIAEDLDPENLVSLYVELYPLFQRAYEDLGYPDGYFNDRLITVIDHLLEADIPDQPVRVAQPHVLYRFSDPELENSSAGRKLMIRMGKENAERIKAKLRAVRRLLVADTSG